MRLSSRPAILRALLALSLSGGCTDGGSTPTDPNDTLDSSDQAAIARRLSIDLADLPSYAGVSLPIHYDGRAAQLDNTPATNPVTDRGATLGRVLFYDTGLSLNRTTSCASCHVQELGFGDSDRFSTGFAGGVTAAHSMRLGNAVFYEAGDMFWDRRAVDLEDQVLQPVVDATEMGFTDDAGGIAALVDRLRSTDYYPILFEWAFGSPDVTELRLRAALSQFVRSMVTANSRYDTGAALAQGLGASFANFTAEENLGKDLFMRPPDQDGAGCAGCHIPPTFALDADSRSNGLDPDERVIFKAPSLKNVALGTRFMHDGRFESLEAVVAHYDSGVQPGPALDRRLEEAPGVPRILGLTTSEREALVAFLGTLTDRTLLDDPRFSDPFLR